MLKIHGEKFLKNEIVSFDVDAQNTFTSLCPGELPVLNGHLIVEELNTQSLFASKRIGSKDAHSLSAIYNATDNQPQFSIIEGEPNADIRWNSHAIVGTFGFKLIEGLPKVTEYDYFVWKGIETNLHPYGACYHDLQEKMSTGVIEYLKYNNIRLVIVGGLAIDYCVKTTVLQLVKVGFKVVVNLSACRGISEDTIKSAISEMNKVGCKIVVSSSELKSYNIIDDPI